MVQILVIVFSLIMILVLMLSEGRSQIWDNSLILVVFMLLLKIILECKGTYQSVQDISKGLKVYHMPTEMNHIH